MTILRDCSVIVKTGPVPEPRRVLGLVRRASAEMPVAERGQRIIYLKANGEPVGQGPQLTPGEQVWKVARTFAVVDMSQHQIELLLDDVLSIHQASFDIVVSASVQVEDPAALVASGSSTVGAVLEPLLRNAARAELLPLAERRSKDPAEDSLPKIQAEAERLVAPVLLRAQGTAPSYLKVVVNASEVRLSGSGREHVNALQKIVQEGQRDRYGELNERRKRQARADAVAFWFEEFKKRMEPRLAQMMALAMMDPDREHVNDFIAVTRVAEREQQKAVIETFQLLVKKRYVDDTNPLIQAISNRLVAEVSFEGPGGYINPPSIEGANEADPAAEPRSGSVRDEEQ